MNGPLPERPASIAGRRVLVDGALRPATVSIREGAIAAIGPFDPSADLVLGEGRVLLPGLVDSHVHLNEPGRTAWEGFATGTAAAALGGVTTVVDMPLNSIPVTTTPAALTTKREAAAGQLAVDLGYWGGAVPENIDALRDLLATGVVGVKCFLAPSGIDEFGHLDARLLERALTQVAAVDGLLIAHAELEEHLGEARGPVFADFVASRPPRAEAEAVRMLLAAARRTGARVHVVHVSSAEVLALVRAAQAEGVRVSVETCPHYLALRAEDVPDGEGRFKCCPPIREAAHQDALWAGVLDGTISAIVSDHSPATAALKDVPDLGEAWGGIAGVQTALPVVWTEAHRRGLALEQVLPLLTTGPADLVGLPDRGRIAVGSPAHLVTFDPDAAWTLSPDDLAYRHAISPWAGARLRGRVEATYLRGELIATPEGVRARAGREVFPGPG